jgi:hypothetical protein
MWYRIGATRSITGGRKIEPGVRMADRLKDVSTQYRRLYIFYQYTVFVFTRGKLKILKVFLYHDFHHCTGSWFGRRCNFLKSKRDSVVRAKWC